MTSHSKWIGIAISVVCILLLSGCNLYENLGEDPLIGCWEVKKGAEEGTILKFDSNYLRVMGPEGKMEESHSYVVQDQTLILGENGDDSINFQLNEGKTFLTLWDDEPDDLLVVSTKITCSGIFADSGLGSTQYLPERCVFPAELGCIGKAVVDATDSTVTFVLSNNVGYSIEFTDSGLATTGNCSGPSTVVFGDTPGTARKEVSNGGTVKVTITCGNPIPEGRFTSDITLKYESSHNGVFFPVTGEIQTDAKSLLQS